jgi:hypothetical protein
VFRSERADAGLKNAGSQRQTRVSTGREGGSNLSPSEPWGENSQRILPEFGSSADLVTKVCDEY